MNPIQKAWLQILQPVSFVINEKLAKRSGLLGKIGRFFMIGPREYGVHPLNRMFIFLNRKYLSYQGVALHRYSFIKNLTHNGYHMIRIVKHASFVLPTCVLAGLGVFAFYGDSNKSYAPDRFPYLKKKAGDQALPLGSLNQRTSAHLIECNSIYGAEMVKRYHSVWQQIIQDRNLCTEEEKKTKYAREGYQYKPLPAVHLPNESPFGLRL
ncbi:hypothetical protein IMG5_117260 [Ichthyophthirius multifiliis]|uniref:Uncharacterized protein n=1 Tax=Ichthyophthirius multifiliis TaxID=5932 RepID=G0QUI2_ICHMU|nr:hypothetical protein IMG5_117260 [Ichthyophthirius multifiliis]EGR31133.1 hypothetical protein IMG5_117260 [Ichthyophthirius multifiliis]|eukprot:XP_004034619.1 hypothetical protein IMG5_117260 [Ichthyophthirius multifiliis]